MTIGELLAEEVADLPATRRETSSDGVIAWSRGGRTFAAVAGDGSSAEFGLDPAVADAAIRTPDVAASGRGPGWIRFAPAVLDDRAADRAAAWLASAHRRLGPRD